MVFWGQKKYIFPAAKHIILLPPLVKQKLYSKLPSSDICLSTYSG